MSYEANSIPVPEQCNVTMVTGEGVGDGSSIGLWVCGGMRDKPMCYLGGSTGSGQPGMMVFFRPAQEYPGLSKDKIGRERGEFATYLGERHVVARQQKQVLRLAQDDKVFAGYRFVRFPYGPHPDIHRKLAPSSGAASCLS